MDRWGWGFRENLAPSGVLEKLIPKDTQPWLCCPRRPLRDQEWVSGQRLLEAILEGNS